MGLEAGDLRPHAGQLAAALAGEDVEAPRLGEPVVRRVHGTLQDALDELLGHRVPLHSSYALARLYGANHVHRPPFYRVPSGKTARIHLSWPGTPRYAQEEDPWQ